MGSSVRLSCSSVAHNLSVLPSGRKVVKSTGPGMSSSCVVRRTVHDMCSRLFQRPMVARIIVLAAFFSFSVLFVPSSPHMRCNWLHASASFDDGKRWLGIQPNGSVSASATKKLSRMSTCTVSVGYM